MQNFHIGCGPITWYALARMNKQEIDPEQVLADIAQAGYEGAATGPHKGQSAQDVLDQLARHNLKAAPGYLGANFWEQAEAAAILETARTMATFHKAAGLTEIYVAAGGFDGYVTARDRNRRQIAGNVRTEDMMTDEEFTQFARLLNQVGEITLEQGVKSCFHNHVGSTIETREEIDRLFALIDRSLIFMGPDTGHLAWGGVDVLNFCRDYADSIKTIHIKDVDKAVMDEGIAAEWDYGTFSAKGIWAELGDGYLDFPAIFDVLTDAGFAGWVIVETDVTQLPTPLDSAVASRNYLSRLGY